MFSRLWAFLDIVGFAFIFEKQLKVVEVERRDNIVMKFKAYSTDSLFLSTRIKSVMPLVLIGTA